MKNIRNTFLALMLGSWLSSCHDLSVPVVTQLTPEIFPQTAQQFVQAAGPTYNAFRGSFAVEYFFMQSISTDESIMPARGGNWYDNGRYEQHHKHSWTPDNAHVAGTWNWLTSTISTSNQNIFLIEKAPESAAKLTSIAELRTMRAICLFIMMDLWGNVPLTLSLIHI